MSFSSDLRFLNDKRATLGNHQFMSPRTRPKHALDEYRKFIREAAPYVSVVMGRRIEALDADRFSDDEIETIAIVIDGRAEALKKEKSN